MSYLGWCYTKPKLDAASPPEYSGPRARAQLGALYNALIYRQLEEERSAIEVQGGLVAELTRFHHRYDTHGRAMTGCLLLLFPGEMSPEARDAVLRDVRELVFSQDLRPELTDAARAYEAFADEATVRWSLTSRVERRAHLIGGVALLSLFGAWGLYKMTERGVSEPPSVGAGELASQVGTAEESTRRDSASEMGGPLSAPDARSTPMSTSRGDHARSLKVHEVITLEGCLTAYRRSASERAAWSAWTRASLSRRCQALAVRAARSDLRVLESVKANDRESPPDEVRDLCDRRREQLRDLAQRQALERDPALELFMKRCDLD